jgi:3-hydroxyisobutyrate dehydrogenase-like beta-hydroxyacid dehydrogenase
VRIGFIGLGNMGFPMAQRLLESGHQVVAFDVRSDAVDGLVALGAQCAASSRDVADRAETVMISLPTPAVALQVATEAAGGSTIRRLVDLSTVGRRTALAAHEILADRGIARVDSPVSGGVGGARMGTLAVMVSGPPAEFELVRTTLEQLGRPIYVGEQPGAAQTMKLANNLLAANVLAATSEVVVMGTKAGLEPAVMIEVLNASSGGTSASRDKFPRAILPRSFDYGFATGLMAKDVRLYLDEARALGVPADLAEAICHQWELTARDEGPDSDFTSVIKPFERAAGVTVGGQRSASV